MGQTLQLLMLEDNPDDATLILREIRRAGFEPNYQLVQSERDYLLHLDPNLDLILSDFDMPQFSGLRALELLKSRGLEVPFILLSGTIGEEVAVEVMKRGATDYLLKDRLARLGQSIEQALQQNRLRYERQAAVTALRESEERLLTVVRTIEEALWISQPGAVEPTYLSPAFEHIWGRSVAEVLARPGLIMEAIHWEDRPVLQEAVARQAAGERTSIEYRILRPDGTQRWVWDQGFPVKDGEGRVMAVNGIAADITHRRETEAALRQAEEKYRSIFENAVEGIYQSDAEGNFTSVNPAAARILGFAKPEELLADSSRAGVSRHVDLERYEEFKRLLARHGQVTGFEHAVFRKDGSVVWVREAARVLRDANGWLAGYEGTMEDITEQRRLGDQLRQAQKMEAIGLLSGGIAHDFNNILGAIVGNAQISRMDLEAGHPARQCLDEILAAAKRAGDLVRQIMAFARQQPQARQVVAIDRVVGESCRLLRATLPAGVEIQFRCDGGLPAIVADETQIEQIVLNLGTNAWHALDDRPGRIIIELTSVDVNAQLAAKLPDLNPGRYVRLTVADNGRGMDPSTLDRIFEPFFTTKAKGLGTGLGLAVVHGIVKSYQGAIEVTSRPNQGTVFSLYFPASEREVLEAEAGARRIPHGHGERILFLDDEAPLVSVMCSMLRRLGYIPRGFGRPEEALAAIRSDPSAFDAVMTDFNMPGMSGLEVAREVMTIRADMPLIICSGHITSDLVERARALGIRDLIPKPNTLEQLGVRLHEAVSHPSPRRN